MTDLQTTTLTDDPTTLLAGRSVLFLTADEGVEKAELVEPWRAVEEAGGLPVLASTGGADVQLFEHLDGRHPEGRPHQRRRLGR